MKISLTLYGNLRRYFEDRSETKEIDVEPGTTVQELIERFQIRRGAIWLISVNGELKDASYSVSPGDDVRFFEPVTGGNPAARDLS
jgi:molybdopterin converting factor small subunit